MLLIKRYMTNSDIHSTFFLEATAHLTNNTIIKITWKNDKPIQTEQWPLAKDKEAAKELIDTKLKLKHIEESCSPQNSPIFVIKKKSGNWHPCSCTICWSLVQTGTWWTRVDEKKERNRERENSIFWVMQKTNKDHAQDLYRSRRNRASSQGLESPDKRKSSAGFHALKKMKTERRMRGTQVSSGTRVFYQQKCRLIYLQLNDYLAITNDETPSVAIKWVV